MKKLLTIIMLLFTFTVYSQEQSTVAKTISTISDKVDTLKKSIVETAKAVDTSSVSKQLYSDLKSGIVGIAGALKVGAEHVYVILIKQQVVDAVLYIICGIIALIFLIQFAKRSKDKEEQWYIDEDGGSPTWIGIMRIFQVVIGFILLLVFFFHLDNITTGFINPEFGALEQIMDWVKEHH